MKFKVGDKVVFYRYFSDLAWEKDFGVDVGDVVTIKTVGNSDYSFFSKTGCIVFTADRCLKPYNENKQDDTKPIKSDGGSSSYYFTKIPQHLIDKIVETGGIEIKDIVRYVYDNNADAFNIVKAQKRIIEYRKGKGKEGIDMLYDANKIKFFAEEQYSSILQEGKE